MREGQVYALNDPYRGGTHLPDITVIMPVFAGGETPVYYVAARGHHADVGGTTPGSMPPDSRTLAEEGVVFDDMLIVEDGEQLPDGLFAQHAVLDNQHIVEHHAFLGQRPAVGWHGAGRGTADIGMMPACRDIIDRRLAPGEDRHDDRDVGQMGAATIRIVQHQRRRVQPLLRGQPPPPFRALFRGEIERFGVAGRQRRIFARLRGVLQPTCLDVRVNFSRAAGKCFHHIARHAGDLEGAVATIVPGNGGEAERLDTAAERRQEHRIHDVLALVQLVRVQRPPLAVGGAGRVGDDVVDV